MNRFLILILFSFFLTNLSFGQYNMTFVGSLGTPYFSNDIWGYVADDGTEYALLGTSEGVSVISLTDPANPTEVAFLNGPTSGWRDMKTFGNYGYVTHESIEGGLFVMDLTDPLGTIDTTFYQPLITVDGKTDNYEYAHNLYIDEFGYCYITGSNLNEGGILIFDLNANPTNPPYVGSGPAIYSHDVFVQDNIMYTSDIYAGEFSMYDVSDKSNVTFLGSHTTPYSFTHSAWASEDGKTLFAADEQINAPVSAYDISDPSNILFLDEIRSSISGGDSTIPHNVHVLDDFVVTSYYTDGVVVFDGRKPDNLVEVAYYDTWSGPANNFGGAWGAYPFLPSGLLLVSDDLLGLVVLQPSYSRACYLEGQITDNDTGSPIFKVDIKILGTPVKETTGIDGNYKTGHGTAGTFMVELSHLGYETKTVSATLVNGQITILDVSLLPLSSFTLMGSVEDENTQSGIFEAKVLLHNAIYEHERITDISGDFEVPFFLGGTYDVFAGYWGYNMRVFLVDSVTENPLIIELTKGYEDIFELDLGWTVSGNAGTGNWTREVPIGTVASGWTANPEEDFTDQGKACYVTGNGIGDSNDFDVDGSTRLTSPVFDMSAYNQPILTYQYWFFRNGLSSTTDNMIVELSNGNSTVLVANHFTSQSSWRQSANISLKNYLPLTENMTISFIIKDTGTDDVVEGGIDHFFIYDNDPVRINSIETDKFSLQISPNPSTTDFQIDYLLEQGTNTAKLLLYNNLGQLVDSQQITAESGSATIGKGAPTGIYFIQIESVNGHSKPYKVVKIAP